MTQGELTFAKKYRLNRWDIQTLFYLRRDGYTRMQLSTLTKSVQDFVNSPESKEAMSSKLDFEEWKEYYFN